MNKDIQKLEELLVNTVKSILVGINDSNIDLKIELFYEERIFQHSTWSGAGVTYTPKISLELKTGNK